MTKDILKGLLQRLIDISDAYQRVQRAGHYWLMFRQTNKGAGAVLLHNERVDEYNKVKFWFQRKLEYIGD